MDNQRDDIYEKEILSHIEKMIIILDKYKQKDNFEIEDYLGIERALQILIESLIGFGRYTLKIKHKIKKAKTGEVLDDLLRFNIINQNEYNNYKQITAFRNILVHDYLNIQPTITINILKNNEYKQILNGYQKLLKSL